MLHFLIASLAIAPGVHAWWTGRALLTRTDDPAFPELVLARSQRTAQIAVAAAVLSVLTPGSSWIWAFPLFALSLLTGGFPFRRTLYGETWSVAGYLRYAVFGFIGMAGFWMALAFTPFLILSLVEAWSPHAPVEMAMIVGAILAVALVIWEHGYPLLWLALHRASPLRRADLQSRFDEIVRRSTTLHRPPQVFRYGAPGAYVMNAIALPSARQPRVAFGDTLLGLLSPDEIVAVFAHEVSHLEYFDRRRMLRLRLVTYLLMLGGTAFPAVLLAAAPAFTWAVKLAWPAIVLLLLASRATKSQAHETESDLRAGVLTGDPEAMVRALTKLHHYSRMPRRWPYDFERAASHPSLARRIQALRTEGAAAAGAPATAVRLDAATLLRSTEPGAHAALDDQRAYWFDGVPDDAVGESVAELRERATSYRAVAYADLTELRVAVGRGGTRSLLARDRAGKTWSMPLRAEDVAAAQRALDVLDVRLSDHVREDWAMKARLIAAVLALALISALDFSWPWIPLLLTLAKPSRAAVAAMGLMATGRVVLSALAGNLAVASIGAAWPVAWLSVTVVFGIGVWACRLAWRWTRGDERPSRQPAMIVTAILSILLVGALAGAGVSTYGSEGAVPLSLPIEGPAPTVAMLLLGVGGAMLTHRDLLRRRSGAAVVAVALAVGGLTVDAPLLFNRGDNSRIAWTSGQAEIVGRIDVNGSAYRLHSSPGGQRFAVQSTGRGRARYEDDGSDDQTTAVWKFTLATLAGDRRVTEAIDLTFVDDERVLALRSSGTAGDSLEVSLERAVARDSARLSRWVIPAHYAPTLTLDRTSGTWRVVGHHVRAGAVVTSAGKIGSDSVTTARVPAGTGMGRPLYTYRDGSSLVAALHGSYGVRQMLLSVLGFYPFRWDVWRVANGERRRVGVLPGMPECGGRDDAVLCVARGRSAPTLWRVPAGDGTPPSSLGVLPASLNVWDIGPDARLAAASYDGGTLAVVDAALGRGTRVALGAGGVQLQGSSPGSSSHSYTADVAIGPDAVAALVIRDGKSQVVVYRVR